MFSSVLRFDKIEVIIYSSNNDSLLILVKNSFLEPTLKVKNIKIFLKQKTLEIYVNKKNLKE